MDSTHELKPLRSLVHSALVAVTRSVNTLANEDLRFQRTVHTSVATRLDQNTDRILKLADGVLKSASRFTAQRRPKLDDVDDVEIQWKGVVDVIDTLLEKSDTCLDEYTGLVKKKDAPAAEPGSDLKRAKPTNTGLAWSLRRANILKPQSNFEKKPQDPESGPWKPQVTAKPHAQVPLAASFVTFVNGGGHSQYKHPYEHEIASMRYPAEVYQRCEPTKYPPIDHTQAVWVDTFEDVLEMLEELKKAKEIAIDLEHHDYRSYNGLLSLMQISTRDKDWIVDTLVPWRHKLEVLNEVFADPKIVKVLHGGFMDIIWLQRDLGLYVVGLFDTFYASDTLGYARKSLAFLLKKFVDFDADKKYQLADWRIRPLPQEMLYYARSDTHFLLYIYDMVRNELVQLASQNDGTMNPIDRVLEKSKEVSLQRYEHPICDAETGVGNRGWFNTLVKSPALYNGEQFAVYKSVYKWRDDLARKEDESPTFFMSQQAINEIARILPTDRMALWNLLGPNAHILRSRVDQLFEVVQAARRNGVNGPTKLQFFMQFSSETGPTQQQQKPAAEGDNKPLEIEELKSSRSQLWGDMAINSALDGTSKPRPMDEKDLIPLYTFDFGAVREELPDGPAPPPHDAVEKTPGVRAVFEDEGFTLRTGKKRKASSESTKSSSAKAGSTPPETDEYGRTVLPDASISDSESSNTEALEGDTDLPSSSGKNAGQAEAKRAKHEVEVLRNKMGATASQQLKAQAGSEDHSQLQAQAQAHDEVPFDYANASSVLRAPSKGDHNNNDGSGGKGGKGKGKRGGKAAFDPYAKKSGDAPQGARKLNYERAGRTATFKK
ncbi:ribonuclease H-like domain-containing protein [Chaetomium sp. MPI-SDFR-AT-0129]|nr:ribonuclease H-like domain-containing protein [Chaetomium sp. MPI-SDFR-AT-0129]